MTKSIEERVSEFTSEMIAFEETTPPEEKPIKRAEFIVDLLHNILTVDREDQRQEIVERLEGMKKRELRSPRSFGDNESTVDVSSGYNQAIDDIIKSLSK